MRALCATRPADWWLPEDGGARLALMLCRVCPHLPQCPEDNPNPCGVIVAGVAYGENGKPLPVCANGRCGYPNLHKRGGRGQWNPLCHRCAVPVLRRWDRSRRKYWAKYYRERKKVAA